MDVPGRDSYGLVPCQVLDVFCSCTLLRKFRAEAVTIAVPSVVRNVRVFNGRLKPFARTLDIEHGRVMRSIPRFCVQHFECV